MDTETQLISLGQSDLRVSPLGVGSNAWGAGRRADPGLRPVFEAALQAGINLFDTAEIYNMGGSEKTYGQFLPAARDRALITTKFFPYPWRLSQSNLKSALQASLERLQIKQVDLYLIHFPIPPVKIETWVEALAQVQEAGLVRAVGVSNFSPQQMRRAHAVLSKHGIPLACNQVDYSLLKRGPETSGLLALCKELGITLVAYRPLASGLLSGKPRPANPIVRVDSHQQQILGLLLALMSRIGEAHGAKTISQVALNWLICKGALPIPGATKVDHIRQNAGALGWRLSAEEVQALDQSSAML